MTVKEELIDIIENNWLFCNHYNHYLKFSYLEEKNYVFHRVADGFHDNHLIAWKEDFLQNDILEILNYEKVIDAKVVKKLETIEAKLELVDKGVMFETTFKG